MSYHMCICEQYIGMERINTLCFLSRFSMFDLKNMLIHLFCGSITYRNIGWLILVENMSHLSPSDFGRQISEVRVQRVCKNLKISWFTYGFLMVNKLNIVQHSVVKRFWRIILKSIL